MAMAVAAAKNALVSGLVRSLRSARVQSENPDLLVRAGPGRVIKQRRV
jgi:hypothetical protein